MEEQGADPWMQLFDIEVCGEEELGMEPRFNDNGVSSSAGGNFGTQEAETVANVQTQEEGTEGTAMVPWNRESQPEVISKLSVVSFSRYVPNRCVPNR